MKKKGFILIFMMLTTLSLVSCTSKSTNVKKQTPENKKKITIGYDLYKPYAYIAENGQCTGIDIEIARKACERMGYEPVFKRITWGYQRELLKEKKIDCVWCGFSENGRQTEYQWTKPYLKSQEVVVVRSDSHIRKLGDLTGKKVAVQVDTKAEEYFENQIKNGKIKVSQISTYKNMKEAMASFNKGYVDAIATHEATLKEYTKNNRSSYRFLKTPIVYSKLGVAFDKAYDEKTVDLLSNTLQDMTEDGTIKKIIENYKIDTSRLMEGASNDRKESK